MMKKMRLLALISTLSVSGLYGQTNDSIRNDSLFPLIHVKLSLQPLGRGTYSLLTHDNYDSTVYISWNYKNLDSVFSKVPEAYKYYCKAERNLKLSRSSSSFAVAGLTGIIILLAKEREDDALMAPSFVFAVGGTLTAWISAKIAFRQMDKAVYYYNEAALKNGRRIPENVQTREEANEPPEE